MAEWYLIFSRMVFNIRFEVEYFVASNHHFFAWPTIRLSASSAIRLDNESRSSTSIRRNLSLSQLCCMWHLVFYLIGHRVLIYSVIRFRSNGPISIILPDWLLLCQHFWQLCSQYWLFIDIDYQSFGFCTFYSLFDEPNFDSKSA